ncbi:glycosyltransferase family 2 protein [Moraxella sp. CTOTU49803]|uniref:glycosyltransferase family 2 protein n=1 Tax=Moraxella sp. CTOTU49803 TaxID=2953840 RepID=UPI0028A8D27D|nr:glycosyltransferase family 2 protein [Moraxella sp. CTOTU49803]
MQADKDLISVGIPFFNAEKFLSKAIESVISQSYDKWELLLLDDGSNDGSLKIAKGFEQQDNRIKVFSDGKNKGLGARLNELATLSNGEYIARMDADDIMHPKRLETQLQILKDNPNIDVLGTNAYVIDENDSVFGMRYRENSGMTKVEHFIHPTIMAKKQWFLDNPYDEKAIRIEDAELWFRTKSKSNFRMISEPLLFYREFGSCYYPKYIKVIPSLIYLNNKYPLNKFWIRVLVTSSIAVPTYWFFEVILKNEALKERRNKILFKQKKHYREYI